MISTRLVIGLLSFAAACEPSKAPPAHVPLAPTSNRLSSPNDQDIDELGALTTSTHAEPITDLSPVKVEGEEIALRGGDGTAQQKAIVIVGPRSVSATRLAENAILFRAFGKNLRFVAQEPVKTNTHAYDLVTIERPNGKRPAVWFDVTDAVPK